MIELGAGLGALTRPLLATGVARLVAVERDRDLVPALAQELAGELEGGRLEILEADAKSVDFVELLAGRPKPHVVAGNLPYQITGPLLQKAVHIAPSIERAVFLVQLEVVDRLAAGPGSDAYGALSVFVQRAFKVERAFVIRRGAFYPQPNVDSAVVTLEPRGAGRRDRRVSRGRARCLRAAPEEAEKRLGSGVRRARRRAFRRRRARWHRSVAARRDAFGRRLRAHGRGAATVKRRALLLAVTLGAALGCDHAPKGVVKEAAFGVFFGGQVQQLKEVAKELDPARQQHGFRLVFGAPLTHDVPVEWELSLPVPDKGGPRPALVGQATAKTGESVLEVPLVFRPHRSARRLARQSHRRRRRGDRSRFHGRDAAAAAQSRAQTASAARSRLRVARRATSASMTAREAFQANAQPMQRPLALFVG